MHNMSPGSSEACRELLSAGANTEAADVEGLTRKMTDSLFIILFTLNVR